MNMEGSERKLKRKLATIFYTDVVGYSQLTGEDEEGTQRRLSEYLDLIADLIGEHMGRVGHYAADAVLADFDTATAALGCAASTQQEFASRNINLTDNRKA